jgi:hypothetical protein
MGPTFLVFSLVLSLSVAELSLDDYDYFGVPRTNYDGLISEAQLIVRVNFVKISNKKPNYRARVNVSCAFKGTLKKQSLNIYGINSPMIARITGRVEIGDEAIIFATKTQHSRKWQLIYDGLIGAWAERNITTALGFPTEHCHITSSVGETSPARTLDTSPEAPDSTNEVNFNARLITPSYRKSLGNSYPQCLHTQNGNRGDLCSEIPWHAFIWDRRVSKIQCDAVIISDSWVLTSARCVQRYTHRPHRLVLSLGVNAARSMTKSTRANAVVLHPKWQTLSEKHGEYDMALVQFNRSTRNEKGLCGIKPICLADDDHIPVFNNGVGVCFGSITDARMNRVKKLQLTPPYQMLYSTWASGKNLKFLDTAIRDQLRTMWVASVCHAEDGSLRVFQVLSGTPDIKEMPVLTDIRGQVNNWIRNTVSTIP